MDEMRTSVGAIDKLDSRVSETIAMLKSINQVMFSFMTTGKIFFNRWI